MSETIINESLSSQEAPDFIVISRSRSHYFTTLNFEDGIGTQFSVTITTDKRLTSSQADYHQVVNAIIRSAYAQQDVEAIVNNYLADSTDADAVAEMQQMQQWRTLAKEVGKRFREEVGYDG